MNNDFRDKILSIPGVRAIHVDMRESPAYSSSTGETTPGLVVRLGIEFGYEAARALQLDVRRAHDYFGGVEEWIAKTGAHVAVSFFSGLVENPSGSLDDLRVIAERKLYADLTELLRKRAEEITALQKHVGAVAGVMPAAPAAPPATESAPSTT